MSPLTRPLSLPFAAQTAQRLLTGGVYAALGYPATEARVVDRRNVGGIVRAHVRDLRLSFPTPRRRVEFDGYTPYWIDFRGRRLFLARHDPARDGERPFFYMAQREFADAVLDVGFSYLRRTYDPERAAQARPLFVFSVGRCGSTLLSRLLEAGGYRAYSEPDVFSQWSGIRAASKRTLELTLGFSLDCLERRAGGLPVAVKLRSSSSFAYGEIAATFPKARSLFLFRSPRAWARSWVVALESDAAQLVRRLAGSVDALERAQASGHDHRVLWYEDLCRDPGRALADIAGAGTGAADAAAFAGVMAEDSQRGTALAADELRARRAEDAARTEAQVEAFLNAWRAAQDRDRLTALRLDRLIV